MTGPPILYVSDHCNDNAYAYFSGPAETKVRFMAGDTQHMGELHSGSSFGASTDPLLHFGLGPTETITNIEVRYPGEDWVLVHAEANVPARFDLSRD